MKLLLTSVASIVLVCSSIADSTNKTAAPATEQMFTRSYKISTEKFVRNLHKWAPAPIEGESNHDLLVRFFKENNVDITTPSALLLSGDDVTVYVRSSEKILNKIPSLINKIENYIETPVREPSRIQEQNEDEIFFIGNLFEETQKSKPNSGAFSIPRFYYDEQPLMRRYQQESKIYLQAPQSALVPIYNPSRIDLIR
jgi:hypothetical protein